MLICIEDTIKNISNTTNDPIDMILLKILRGGFRDVYRTVLTSAIEDFEIELANYETTYEFPKYLYTGIVEKVFPDYDKLNKMIDEDIDKYKVNFIDLIIDYSIKYGLVFDVASKKFTDRVINSCRTDEEILKATIDLISLLITGNQMIVTQKHNF
jgi:Na+/serine symporter